MQSDFFGPLNSRNQYRAVEGVIQFFLNNKLGTPKSWISYVDAGIIQGIQGGGALVLGLPSARYAIGVNGTSEWQAFLRAMQFGTLTNRNVSHKSGVTLRKLRSETMGNR